MRLVRTILLALALIPLVGLSASAAPITFIYTGTGGSGYLYSLPFTFLPSDYVAEFFGIDFKITATGDTSTKLGCILDPADCSYINHVSASIDISDVRIYTDPTDPTSSSTDLGPASFDFDIATRTFRNNASDKVGFSWSDVNGTDLYDGPAFGTTWNMQSSIGPVSGVTELQDWFGAGFPVLVTKTSGSNQLPTGPVGLFFYAQTISGTFQAIVVPPPPPPPVPEPASIVLLSAGLVGLFSIRRRKDTVD